jgi:hypothetical protein
MIREHKNDEVVEHFLLGNDRLRLTKNLVSVGGYLFSYNIKIAFWMYGKQNIKVLKDIFGKPIPPNIQKHIHLLTSKCVSCNMKWEYFGEKL